MSIIIDGQSLRNHIKYLRRQTFLLNKKIENLPSASGVGSDGIMPAPSNQGANISIANLPVKDEDFLSSNSSTHLATQQSIKAYVDTTTWANGDVSGDWSLANPNDAGAISFFIKDNAGNNLIPISLDYANGLTVKTTLTVGINDTGHDVKFFGATSGQYMLWDESADKLIVTGEVEAGSIKKASNSGGFLKADGTEDTSTYVKAVSSTTNYIPKFSNATTLTNSGIFNSTSGIYIDSTNTAPVYIRRSGINSFKFQCESTSNNSFLSISPGLVSKPGLNFGQRTGTGAQDTNTGIYSSATDNLEIATAGTKAVGFDANQDATFEGDINAGSNTVTAGSFVGSLLGNVNGNVNGNLTNGTLSNISSLAVTGTGTATFAGTVKAEKFTVSALNTAPASATASGTLGDIRFTADYIYVCVATDTWKRVALSTW